MNRLVDMNPKDASMVVKRQSDEIDLLVLRPQGEKEEEIIAVAPYCSPGLSVRDVSGDAGNDRTSTLHLGFLEVVHQSANPRIDDDIDDTNINQDQDYFY